MPDLRISQLPLLSAIQLTDVFPIVPQGSTITYKETIEDLKNFIQPFIVTAVGIPAQGGQAGKFLTTDGTTMSWQNLPTPPIPNLQQVLDAGNQAQQSLRLFGAPNGEDILLIGNDGFVGGKSVLVARNTTLPTGVQHYFMNDRERYDNNNKSLTLSPHSLDDWYDIKYPNSNGTLVTKINGVAADVNGNVVFPVGLQNLNDVLNVGNSASNKRLRLITPDAQIVLDPTVSSGTEPEITIANNTQQIGLVLKKDAITYLRGANVYDINLPVISNDYAVSFPMGSGNLALSVNGISADANGNIVVSGVNQDLQSVTDNGNTTTNDININNGRNLYINNIPGAGGSIIIGDSVAPASYYSTITAGEFELGYYSSVNPALIENIIFQQNRILYNDNSGSIQIMPPQPIGGTFGLTYPQGDGVLALKVNGVSADASGNVQLTAQDIGVPDLEQVLTAGDTAERNILLRTSLVGVPINEIGLFASSGARLTSRNLVALEEIYFDYQKLFFNKGGRVTEIKLQPSVSSGTNNLFLPQASGTLALSINGVSADASGNITLPSITTPSLEDVMNVGSSTTISLELQGAGIFGADFIDFDTTPATPLVNQEGRVQWNSDLKTIQVDTENAGVQINLGHETIQRVRNVTGATLTKGKIVYINGENGNRPTITLSSNTSDATSAQTIGFVIADIPNNNNGYVITNGLLEDINTTGLSSGTQLYLGNNGDFQTAFPTQPLHNVRVGIVINGNSPNGSIFVNILNGYEIEELHDVLITSPQNDEVLTYETSTGLWKNKVVTAAPPTLKTIEGQSLLGTGNIDLGKADVGLSNVDNTSDLNKPISTATQTALNNKQDTLVSATNIKTINGSSILGSGDLPVVASVKTLAGVSLSGTGNVTLDQILPTQTGLSGKVLKTNGTTASWQDDFTGPGGSSDGYCLHLGYAAWNPPTAGNTWTTGWFYGQNPDTLFNDRPSRRFIIPKTGICKSVTILTALGTVGSGGTQQLTIQLQNITSGLTSTIVTGYSIASLSLISSSRQDIFSGLSIPVTAGDVCHIRIIMPTYTTSPTGLSQIFNLFVEQ